MKNCNAPSLEKEHERTTITSEWEKSWELKVKKVKNEKLLTISIGYTFDKKT